MNLNRRHFLGAVAASSAGLVAPRCFAAVQSGSQPRLLPRAMAALAQHGAAVPYHDVIGIVDFSAPSRTPRFSLVDIASGRVIDTHLVAHGSGSDPANSGFVERFSNRPGSNASSPGAFMTGETYMGKHGRSRRLHGLEAENSLAAMRGIVIHAARYVDPDMAVNQGRIGRSQGCFAVSQGEIAEVLTRLGPGRLLFASK